MRYLKGAVDFSREVKVELSKVVWPTPRQALKLTTIVIMVTISVGFFLGVVDLGLTKLLEIILNR